MLAIYAMRPYVFPINQRQPEKCLDKISKLHLRAGHIAPLVQRKLVDDILDWSKFPASTGLNPAGQDFDIEEPPRCEGLLEENVDFG